MSIYTIRPTSTERGDVYFAKTGGTDLDDVTGDASDATYARMSTQQGGYASMKLGDPSIPATEFPDRVIPFMRVNGNSGFATGFGLDRESDGSADPTAALLADRALVYHKQTLIGTRYGNVSTRLWERSHIDEARFGFHSYEPYDDADRAYYYEFGAMVYTQKLASALATAKTQADSSMPAPTVVVTADIDSWQTSYPLACTMRVELEIESGGTGHGTGTLVASGAAEVVFTAAGSALTESVEINCSDYSLTNGTYNMYARVGRQRTLFPGTWLYGDWSAASTLTMNAPLPATPTLSLIADPFEDRVAVSVTPIAGDSYIDPTIEVERSDDGGDTWVEMRDMYGITGTFGSATVVTDYEPSRQATDYSWYRARIRASRSGTTNVSAWCTAQQAIIPAEGWNLKCPEDHSLNMLAIAVIGDIDESMDEDRGVFRTEGSRYPTVVAGQLTGWDGTLQLRVYNADDWASLRALLEAQQVLRLESPWGWHKYIRISGAVSSLLNGAVPRRAISLPYVEVAIP